MLGGFGAVQHIPIIMTRPAGSNSAFLAKMPAALRNRLEMIESPLIEIRPLSVTVELREGEAVIFTSANAVALAPKGQGRTAYCVGSNTTAAAQKAGWTAIRAGDDAAGLVETLLKERPSGSLCHLSGVHLRGDVAQNLSKAGLNARQIALYDQVLVPLSERARQIIASNTPVIVPLFSPRTAAHFSTWADRATALYPIFMSDAVARAWGDRQPENAIIAAHPDARSMSEAIEKKAFEISLG